VLVRLNFASGLQIGKSSKLHPFLLLDQTCLLAACHTPKKCTSDVHPASEAFECYLAARTLYSTPEMSFTFEWPRFSDQFHSDAIQMLNNALNKGNKPPVIADKIEVVELEMGTQVNLTSLLRISSLLIPLPLPTSLQNLKFGTLVT
jgi:hypothetical protein